MIGTTEFYFLTTSPEFEPCIQSVHSNIITIGASQYKNIYSIHDLIHFGIQSYSFRFYDFMNVSQNKSRLLHCNHANDKKISNAIGTYMYIQTTCREPFLNLNSFHSADAKSSWSNSKSLFIFLFKLSKQVLTFPSKVFTGSVCISPSEVTAHCFTVLSVPHWNILDKCDRPWHFEPCGGATLTSQNVRWKWHHKMCA